MKIGIDIDDTLVITLKPMIKYADRYDIEVLGGSGINGDFGLIENRYYLKALYGWSNEEKYGFFDMYYKNVLEECVLMPNADKVCKKLKEEGHQIYFITARLTNVANCDTKKITEKTLEKYDIPYDELIIGASDKLTICKEEGIDLLIEDSYETCKEFLENGIKSILMTTRINQKIDSGNIPRVNDWNEVYQEIN